jgi:hypothetical protein
MRPKRCRRPAERAFCPTHVPGAERTGEVLRGARCFHEATLELLDSPYEWCQLCEAVRDSADGWTIPWLVLASRIVARGVSE